MAATNYKLHELKAMEPEELAFLAFWVNEVETQRLGLFGKLLGANFTAGEIRSWNKEGANRSYKDSDNVMVPLSLVIKPELRESLIKMVGGDSLPLPNDYRKGKKEIVVDLGKVSPQEFLDFLSKKKLPKLPEEVLG